MIFKRLLLLLLSIQIVDKCYSVSYSDIGLTFSKLQDSLWKNEESHSQSSIKKRYIYQGKNSKLQFYFDVGQSRFIQHMSHPCLLSFHMINVETGEITNLWNILESADRLGINRHNLTLHDIRTDLTNFIARESVTLGEDGVHALESVINVLPLPRPASPPSDWDDIDGEGSLETEAGPSTLGLSLSAALAVFATKHSSTSSSFK